MQVNLRRGWFGPDGSLYTPANNPHEFPIDWEAALPSTAKVTVPVKVPEPEVKAPAKVDSK
jgi:uncharacterized membrane protein